jgi:hypothetical protein
LDHYRRYRSESIVLEKRPDMKRQCFTTGNMKQPKKMISGESLASSKNETRLASAHHGATKALVCFCLLLATNLFRFTNATNLNGLSGDARTHYQMLDALAGSSQQPRLSPGAPLDANEPLLFDAGLDLFDSLATKHDLEALKLRRPATAARHQQSPTPGHYEFEVAPKMEPPSAPKPPFKQSSAVCPGSGKCKSVV